MTTTALFEYTCPACGRGTVRTTRILNHKTKIKGYPFVVDEALIGVCDRCQAESFAPEETKRWEELFYRSLEERKAFLSHQEISEIRTVLGLSMEDFARLIGCTRQSISAWEKRDRSSPPSRMADLLMKLVRQSHRAGPVDVLSFLLGEARRWGVIIEVRQPPMHTEQNESVVLRTRKMPKRPISHESSSLALAAEADEGGEDLIVVETTDGERMGVLDYDFVNGALILKDTSNFPPWKTVDVEIETQDGQHFTKQDVSAQQRSLVLLDDTPIQERSVAKITLRPHRESIRR